MAFWNKKKKEDTRRGVSRGRASLHPTQPEKKPAKRKRARGPFRARSWQPTSAGTGKISTASERPNHELLGKLQKLRLKCRSLITSTPQGKAYLRYSLDNILTRRGFEPDYGSDDTTGLRDKVNAAWRDWIEGECSTDGCVHFADLCRMMVRSYLIDGESFVRLYPEHGALRLEVIDPFRVPTLRRTNSAVMGITLDESGRPQAYTIRDLDPQADPSMTLADEVPAEFVKHWAHLDFVNQLRGTPPVTVVMEGIKSQDDFRQYALEAARVNASYIATLNQQGDAFDDFKGNFDDDEDLDGDGTDEGVNVMETEGIQMFQAPEGYTIQPFAGRFPDMATDSFLTAMSRQIATGLGLAAHNVDGDFSGINYSAGRLAEMSQRLHFDQLRDQFIRTTLGPIYAKWLQLMGFPAKRPVWAQADRAQIDPSKEAMTLKTLVSAGIMSRAEAMRQLGHDADEMMAQIEKEGWKNPSDNINANTAHDTENEDGPEPPAENGDE